MPVTPTYPGVYIEEVPSGVRTIAGVATSVAAFVGYFSRGPMDEAVQIFSFADFERVFGGLRADSEASYGIQQFFLNGGTQAWIVRVAGGSPAASTATLQDTGPADVLVVDAANTGEWGDGLSVAVDYDTRDPSDDSLFNLTVSETDGATEVFRNLNMDPASSFYAVDVVNDGSKLVAVSPASPAPAADARPAEGTTALTGGDDGTLPGNTELRGSESAKTGIYALLDVDLFNILCLPDTTRLSDADAADLSAAATALCTQERAFYILDVPHADSTRDEPSEIITWINTAANASLRDKNVALYFPRPQIADPLSGFRLRRVAPSGTLAGLYARTDSGRGVWKAPAGIEASLRGVQKLEYKLTDAENGALNPLGINCLRTFPVSGNLSWGARTLDGADALGSEWKYVPVRRTALFIEESLYRGTQWVVFEPNDESLWAQIRMNLGSFMQRLFQQGAFQGTSPREAYFVKCDSETTTQNDIDLGIVNIVVGFAPLKPAEFVIIKIHQITNQES